MPIFEHLPKSLQWWRTRGLREFNETLKVYRIPWDRLVEDLRRGEAKDCFAAHVYLNREEYGLSETEAMFAVLNAIEGGSDTTRATLNVFVAAMATDPEFLVRVRKELDAVCGNAERLPTYEDQARLPLVTACVKEVLRWMPLVAAGDPITSLI
jgi:cytochrome P450